MTSGTVSLVATETASLNGGACPFAPIPRNTHSYSVRSGSVSGSSLSVVFNGSSANQPAVELTVTGTFNASRTNVQSEFRWRRTDQNPPFAWTVVGNIVLIQ